VPPAEIQALPLSPREKQTLWKLLSGRGEKQIAAEMDLSRNTVHHYVKSLYKHFRVSSRAELLAKWMERKE
jgi:DNA-binding CsgD family transcriptional regulator